MGLATFGPPNVWTSVSCSLYSVSGGLRPRGIIAEICFYSNDANVQTSACWCSRSEASPCLTRSLQPGHLEV